MSSTIIVNRQNGIVELCFDRPDKKNALTTTMYEAMADALTDIAGDPSVRVVLFTGNGGSFTAGNDLKDFLANPPSSPDAPVFRFLRALASSPAVLVAAVSGPAVGIGTTLLLHCDLVLAGESARFSLPFVNLGLVPEAASSLLLPRLIGHQRAAQLMLLGEPFDAQAALGYGLVNQILPDSALAAAAWELAGKLAAKAPAALLLTKKLLKSESISVADRMIEEARDFRAQLDSSEFREAATAFFEKRPPDFSGKPKDC